MSPAFFTSPRHFSYSAFTCCVNSCGVLPTVSVPPASMRRLRSGSVTAFAGHDDTVLAAGTNWVFRDESAHMAFAFETVKTIRREEPELFDADMQRAVAQMFDEAVACETPFAEDILGAASPASLPGT